MRALRFSISHATLGGALSLALVAAAPVANAQMVTPPLATVPAVQTTTTTTVHTIRTVPVHSARRQVVTTRTVTRSITPAAAPIAPPPRPVYDTVAPAVAAAPVAAAVGSEYAAPLYDVAPTPAPVVATAPVVDSGPIAATQPFIYRYIYEPDRILVVDPITGIAVQAIPR
jgi:hypothetical protein